MITYLGNFKWSNGSKTSELTEEGYRGFNGKIASYAPSNTAELIAAVISSSENNEAAISILSTMFGRSPFFSMSADSNGWFAYRQAIAFLRATKDYKGSTMERIVHVVMNKYHLDNDVERSILTWHGEAIALLVDSFEESDIIACINDSEYELCGSLFATNTVRDYLNKKKLMQYLPPDTPQNLLEWGMNTLQNFPNYAQAIAAMIRNGLAQTVLTQYDFSGSWYLQNIPNMFLKYAQRLNIENPNPNGNILNKINQMHLEYESCKNEIIVKRIKKQAQKMQYHAHGFCVVVPTTKAEFKAEAEAQHNCLYNFNYFDKVIKERTNIAFVRKENDLKTPFITCEIDNTGRIIQFYAKNNETPKGENVDKFRKEWQKYLVQTFRH